MKKVLYILLSCVMLYGTFSLAYANPNVDEAETRMFTDSVGRVVEIPANIERIAPSGQLAQIALYSLAREKLVCLNMAWSGISANYIDAACLELPVVGQLYGRNKINIEELLLADPQIIIDIGETKSSIADDMDSVQEQLNIPTVFIEASLQSMDETFLMLGELLGLTNKANEFAEYCHETYSYMTEKIDSIENKVSLLYCLGEQGMNVMARGSYHAELIDMFADNVAVLDEPSSKGTGNEVDFEMLYQWDPKVILFAPESAEVYNLAKNDPLWNELAAIRDGKYYQVPMGPYNWLGFPPSVQRYIGMLWLGNLLYPEIFDYDLYQEVVEYFKLFYDYDELSQDEFDMLTLNALRNSEYIIS